MGTSVGDRVGYSVGPLVVGDAVVGDFVGALVGGGL